MTRRDETIEAAQKELVARGLRTLLQIEKALPQLRSCLQDGIWPLWLSDLGDDEAQAMIEERVAGTIAQSRQAGEASTALSLAGFGGTLLEQVGAALADLDAKRALLMKAGNFAIDVLRRPK